MAVNLLKGLKGPLAKRNPWGGMTLEWQVPSPPPLENFDEIPIVTHGPYDYHYFNEKEEK
jgi:cytochrome c oxidase subunit 1